MARITFCEDDEVWHGEKDLRWPIEKKCSDDRKISAKKRERKKKKVKEVKKLFLNIEQGSFIK